jgi:hypothetical protein
MLTTVSTSGLYEDDEEDDEEDDDDSPVEEELDDDVSTGVRLRCRCFGSCRVGLASLFARDMVFA